MTELMDRLQSALGERYSLERELGGGGMSRVFVAEERALGRRVVIKVLPPEVAAAVSAERFRREVQLAARLQHPHIVAVLSAGEIPGGAGGLLYYTMPFVEGESLRQRLSREGELPIADAVRLLREIVDALAYAHECGVVHRDIKPDNVLLSRGHAVLTDFGIAKALASTAGESGLTSVGMAIGTPAYMAPEQVSADPGVDHRADIYAVGAVAYELLAGRPPFVGESPHQVLAAHITQEPAPLTGLRRDVPEAVGDLVARCLAKRPADRPQSAEILRQLDAVATDPSAGRTAGRPRGARGRTAAAAALAALLALLAGYAVLGRSVRGNVAQAEGPRSVAVLPFANLSPDKEDEYFSDGMTDELMSTLANIPGLRVAARSSVFALKGKAVDAREVARRLGVETVVEGSVRRAGDRLRVTAQLVDARTGTTIWAETFERGARDVFAVQSDLAAAIAGRLRADSGGPGQAPPPPPPTRDLAAYDAYLRGLYFTNQRTCDGFEKGVRAHEEAVRRDTAFAVAYGALAQSYYHLAMPCGFPPRDVMPKARATALRALALDSTVVQARVALASVKIMFDWDADEAIREVRRAIDLSPRYAEARRQYAQWLVASGRAAEGIAEIEWAVALDPLDYVSNVDLGVVLYYAREHDRLIRHARSMLGRNPADLWGNQWLGMAYWVRGNADSAEAAFRRAGSEHYARLASGQRDSILTEVEMAKADAQRGEGSAYSVAIAHAWAGMPDEAFEWLERAYERREAWMMWMAVDPRLDPLRSDARFTQLLRRVGVDASPPSTGS